MNIAKKDLEKSQVELTVELSSEEMKPYVKLGAEKLSREIKIDGFRPGKAPYEVLKAKIGETAILEEAARIAINKTIDKAIKEKIDGQPVGQPQVSITKLAPGNPMEYKVVLAMLPEIKTGDYKNAKIKIEAEEVKEEEVEKIIEYLRESRAREAAVDAPAKKGDKVVVDIEMFLDNVPVEGAQGKGVAIIIGKDFIIPGFDKNLIGAKKGDARDFAIVYPKDHHMANLAGKTVDHKVKIMEVYERELPAPDDDFAAGFGFKKFAEMKESVKKNLEQEKKQKAEQKAEIEMLDKIVKDSRFGDIPDILIDNETRAMIGELEHSVSEQGGNFDDYLTSIKKTREQLVLDMLPEAVKRVKSALVIREIAAREKIEVSDEEVEKKLKELLKRYQGYEKVEARVKEPGYKEYLRNVLANRKVIEKLKEWNVN